MKTIYTIILVLPVLVTMSCKKSAEIIEVGGKAQGGIVIQLPTNGQSGLVALANDGPESMSWQGAETYCDNLTSGGYSDWYLPSWNEMASMWNVLKPTDPDAINPWEGKTYWTSDPVVNSPTYRMAWYCWTSYPIQTIYTGVLKVRPVRKIN